MNIRTDFQAFIHSYGPYHRGDEEKAMGPERLTGSTFSFEPVDSAQLYETFQHSDAAGCFERVSQISVRSASEERITKLASTKAKEETAKLEAMPASVRRSAEAVQSMVAASLGGPVLLSTGGGYNIDGMFSLNLWRRDHEKNQELGSLYLDPATGTAYLHDEPALR